MLTVDGVPAHESAVGRDPDYPGATSDVIDILRAQTGRPLRRVSLAEVRGGGARLARALGEAEGGIAVADAETDADLAALARAALDRGSVLLAGSAGLAAALSAALGREGAPPPLPAGRDWLVVAGSRHPATRAQLDALVAAGATIVRVRAATSGAGADPTTAVSPAVEALRAGRPAIVASAEGDGAGREAIAASLAAAASRVLSEVRPALTCATGGETAHALLRALGASRLDLAGAPANGLALGEVVSAAGPGRLLLTKAGGFGPPDLFIQLMMQ